jgi:hypothetical protein
MKSSIRRYLNFVWEFTAKNRELEQQVMQKLSPPLRSKVCMHIFSPVLVQCQFLAWMIDDAEAVKKLCLRVTSEFFEANDVFISYGEINIRVFVLVQGSVVLSLGDIFRDEEDQRNKSEDRGSPQKMQNLRRSNTYFDLDNQQNALERSGSGPMLSPTDPQESAKSRSDKKFALIAAPAFFGESQIFLSEPEPAQYSARCKTRAEFDIFDTSDIQFVVNELPYIRPRYEDFAEEVKKRWYNAARSSPRSLDLPHSPHSPYSPASPYAAQQSSMFAKGLAAEPLKNGRDLPAKQKAEERGRPAPEAEANYSSDSDDEERADDILRRNSKDLLLGGGQDGASVENPDLFPDFPNLRALFGIDEVANGDGIPSNATTQYGEPGGADISRLQANRKLAEKKNNTGVGKRQVSPVGSTSGPQFSSIGLGSPDHR